MTRRIIETQINSWLSITIIQKPFSYISRKVFIQDGSDCSASYIGETARSAEVRKAEHIRYTKNGKIESLAVAEHVWN